MRLKKSSDFAESSIVSILDDTDRTILESFLSSFNQSIKDKYNLQDKEIKVLIREKDENRNFIPLSIFSEKIGVLETLVKLFHENYGFDFRQQSNILKKTPNNLSVSYFKARRKVPEKFSALDYSAKLPLDIFSKKLTCFESICLHLKKDFNYHEIAGLLKRDERTIWTICKRAKEKGGLK